jgi:hypothetical protein
MAKPTITQSQIEFALNLAKANAAAIEAHREASPLNRADLASDPQLRDNRRAMECLLASFAVKAGLDLDRFEQINSKNQADLRRVVEAQTAAAVKRSPSGMQALRHQAARRRKVLEHRAGQIKPAASPAPFVLDTPIMISTTPGVFVDNIITEPWNSSAKIRVQNGGDSSGFDQVTFTYMWVNPEDTFAVIDVNGFIGANGYCTVGSDGGYLPGVRGSSMVIFANLAVLLGSSSVPATSPIQSILPLFFTNTSN